MTEYEYEYYSTFQKWPNTNTNIIRLSKNDRIRIRIIFGFPKMNEYEYEYYSVWKKHPNTNTNIIRHGNFYRIRIRIRIVPTPYTSESIIQFLEVDLFLIFLNFNTTESTRSFLPPAIHSTLSPWTWYSRSCLRRKSSRKTTAMSKVTPTREMKAKVALMRIRLIWICMTRIWIKCYLRWM